MRSFAIAEPMSPGEMMAMVAWGGGIVGVFFFRKGFEIWWVSVLELEVWVERML